MAFSFGFSGDDFDNVELVQQHEWPESTHGSRKVTGSTASISDVYEVDFDETLALLPSSLQYRLHRIPIESACDEDVHAYEAYPRRELHDIRTQIMAEADLSSVDRVLEAGLSSHGDLVPGVYEGGFKTWECSYDLASRVRRLLRETPESHLPRCFVELGAGTALPSSVVLAHLLRTLDCNSPAGARTVLALADYNEAVLRLSTLPSMILTWYEMTKNGPALLGEGNTPVTDEGYVELTQQLKDTFMSDLHRRGIHIMLLAGSWGENFSQMILNRTRRLISDDEENRKLLIMASETIYSPSMTRLFSATVLSMLHSDGASENAKSTALVAAKKLYFGVGGGVDDFKRVIGSLGATVSDEWEGGQGVGRWLGRVLTKPPEA